MWGPLTAVQTLYRPVSSRLPAVGSGASADNSHAWRSTPMRHIYLVESVGAPSQTADRQEKAPRLCLQAEQWRNLVRAGHTSVHKISSMPPVKTGWSGDWTSFEVVSEHLISLPGSPQSVSPSPSEIAVPLWYRSAPQRYESFAVPVKRM